MILYVAQLRHNPVEQMLKLLEGEEIAVEGLSVSDIRADIPATLRQTYPVAIQGQLPHVREVVYKHADSGDTVCSLRVVRKDGLSEWDPLYTIPFYEKIYEAAKNDPRFLAVEIKLEVASGFRQQGIGGYIYSRKSDIAGAMWEVDDPNVIFFHGFMPGGVRSLMGGDIATAVTRRIIPAGRFVHSVSPLTDVWSYLPGGIEFDTRIPLPVSPTDMNMGAAKEAVAEGITGLNSLGVPLVQHKGDHKDAQLVASLGLSPHLLSTDNYPEVLLHRVTEMATNQLCSVIE